MSLLIGSTLINFKSLASVASCNTSKMESASIILRILSRLVYRSLQKQLILSTHVKMLRSSALKILNRSSVWSLHLYAFKIVWTWIRFWRLWLFCLDFCSLQWLLFTAFLNEDLEKLKLSTINSSTTQELLMLKDELLQLRKRLKLQIRRKEYWNTFKRI